VPPALEIGIQICPGILSVPLVRYELGIASGSTRLGEQAQASSRRHVFQLQAPAIRTIREHLPPAASSTRQRTASVAGRGTYGQRMVMLRPAFHNVSVVRALSTGADSRLRQRRVATKGGVERATLARIGASVGR
jgi:hypothetical protein